MPRSHCVYVCHCCCLSQAHLLKDIVVRLLQIFIYCMVSCIHLCFLYCRIVKLVDNHKNGNGTRWLENWQKLWDANLVSCVDGECMVKLS